MFRKDYKEITFNFLKYKFQSNKSAISSICCYNNLVKYKLEENYVKEEL